jgi:hypothetical protein
MSSTPITTDAPSSRVQSASKQETPVENTNVTTEKTSRPPSAAQKTAADTSIASVIAATEADISSDAPAAGNEETSLSAVESLIRPPSANTSTTIRPGSASQNVSQDTTNRPPSAAAAATVDLTPDATTTEPKPSRPPSATQGTDELSSHGYSIVTTDVRPPSASQKINSRPPSASQTPTVSTSSRPTSANQKSNDLNPAPIGSRPSTASQKTDTTSVNESNNITPRIGSRPPSANQKQIEPTIDDTTVGQHTNSGIFDLNNPNITQPIIGRPPSAAKQPATDETDTTPTVDTLTDDVPSSDENKPVEGTPTTTAENNS